MATQFYYRCSNCGFTHYGFDRLDELMAGPTFKIECRDCQELYDIGPFDRPPNERRNPPEADPKCPEDSDHDCRLWPQEQPCPRCGAPLEKGWGGADAD